MEKTHRVVIDFIKVEDKTWNIVARWTQKKVFNAMINFLMDGFKIPRSQRVEDDHQVLGIVGNEKFCTEVYRKITNSEVNKLRDIAQGLKKVMPKSLRQKMMTVEFQEQNKTWDRVTTILSMMGIHIQIKVEKYISEST
jgi:hypothetical protein